MTTKLDKEIATYNKHRDELLGKAEGKYVLIHEDHILDIFTNERDAVTQGYQRLGNVPFLVKQILKVEQPLNFLSNILAI